MCARKVPLVAVISASHLEDGEKKQMEETADYFLPKPLDLLDVRTVVLETLQT